MNRSMREFARARIITGIKLKNSDLIGNNRWRSHSKILVELFPKFHSV